MAGTRSKPFAIPKEALTFFARLEKNNKKEWFDKHKEEYRANVLEPLKNLVSDLGSSIQKKLPGLSYEPRVNGSIFRINRDVRFSKNKKPYKTHAGVFLWVGPDKKLNCPGIYFHLESKRLLIGAGAYMFSPESLARYREYVDEKGNLLAKAIKKAEKAGFELGGEKLKRVPSRFDKEHKHAELLKMKGLWVEKTCPATVAIKGDLVKWLAKEYAPALDVVKALGKALF